MPKCEKCEQKTGPHPKGGFHRYCRSCYKKYIVTDTSCVCSSVNGHACEGFTLANSQTGAQLYCQACKERGCDIVERAFMGEVKYTYSKDGSVVANYIDDVTEKVIHQETVSG